MSYSCTISFKQISGNEVYSFLQDFKKAVTEHLADIAENNYIFSPIMRSPSNIQEELTPDMYEATKNWARNSIFHHRFFYNSDLQLLGVYAVHKSLEGLFDCTVYFQNSCDQDYEFDEWKGIKAFEEIAEKWRTMPQKDVLSACNRDAEDINKSTDLDYCRRTGAYNEIWELIKDTLFDDSSVLYISLFGAYDFHPLGAFVHHCAQCALKFVEECEKTDKTKEN